MFRRKVVALKKNNSLSDDFFFPSLCDQVPRCVEAADKRSVGKDVLEKDRHMRFHNFASGSLGFCFGWLSWVDPRRDTSAHGITGCQHKGR